MAKAELTTVVTPKCQRLADEMGYELVDVCLDKENTGKFLRIYVDRPEGMSLDDCDGITAPLCRWWNHTISISSKYPRRALIVR